MRPRLAPWIAPLAGAVLGLVRMTSFDLPLMVASGDRLLRTGAVPETNPFHWPHPDFPWLDDKWGFGLLCAAADRAGGGAALSILNALLGALAGVLLHALARRRCAPWTAAGVAAFGVTVLSYRSMLRAEWISALGVAWTLLQIGRIHEGSWRRALLVVAAVPFWAACHVYWFLAPALLLAALPGARSRRGAVLSAAAVTLSFAAAALSPYGAENLVHPFRILTQVGTTEMADAIVELRLPFVSGGPWTGYHVFAAVAATLAALWAVAAFRAGQRAAVLTTLLLLAVSLRYDRNLAFLGVAVAAAGVPSRLVSRRADGRLSFGVAYDFGTGAAAAQGGDDDARAALTRWPLWVAAAFVLGHLTGLSWFAPERRAGLGWDDRAIPVALAESTPLAGERFINDFSLGSWLDREAGSSFIDGNTHGYPTEHFTLYRRLLDGSVAVGAIDARFPNDGWCLRTSAPHTRVLVAGLLLEGDYAPVAHDQVATIFCPVAEPEDADRLWRTWLGDVYLPVASSWFPPNTDDAGRPLAEPAKDDVAAWRALVVRNPWDRRSLEGLQRAFDARGEPVQAARIWRIVRRLPDEATSLLRTPR